MKDTETLRSSGASARYKVVCKLLGKGKTKAIISAVHEDDDPTKPLVSSPPSAVLQAASDILRQTLAANVRWCDGYYYKNVQLGHKRR